MGFWIWATMWMACGTTPERRAADASWCEVFAEPDDCFEQAVQRIAEVCPVPSGEVGQLNASLSECAFSDGTTVFFSPPLSRTFDAGAPVSLWIEREWFIDTTKHVLASCNVYTAGDAYPLEVGYRVEEEHSLIVPDTGFDTLTLRQPAPIAVFWSQFDESQAINLSCEPTSLTTVDPDELLTCSDFPTDPLRITNFSQNGLDGRTFFIEGTSISISCGFPEV